MSYISTVENNDPELAIQHVKYGKRCGVIPEIDWLREKTDRLTGGGLMIPPVRKNSLKSKDLPSLNLSVFKRGRPRGANGRNLF